jgi:uncharacterized protein YbjQ (UPF0145 family)
MGEPVRKSGITRLLLFVPKFSPNFCQQLSLVLQSAHEVRAIKAVNGRKVMDDGVLAVTTNDVPGYEVIEVYGEVFGVMTRSRNALSNLGAGLKSIVGGEIGAYTKLLSDSRIEATERMKQSAVEQGANAVLAMRFDTGEIGQNMNEVAAYGTAVKLRPVIK